MREDLTSSSRRLASNRRLTAHRHVPSRCPLPRPGTWLLLFDGARTRPACMARVLRIHSISIIRSVLAGSAAVQQGLTPPDPLTTC